MSQQFFVTATGTDIGKTYVTCQLLQTLIKKNISCFALKPIISGWEDNNSDIDTLKIINSLKLELTLEIIDTISPWRLKAPLSPNMAAKHENIELNFNHIVNFCQKSHEHDIVLIEGVGGVMVPINKNKTILDLMVKLDLPTILITGTYLGSISHALTSYQCLKQAGITIASLIVNETKDSTVSTQETIDTLKTFCDCPIIKLDYNGTFDELEPIFGKISCLQH